jgi:hypothetical protein
MAIIQSYPINYNVKDTDLLLGITNIAPSGNPIYQTKSFRVSDIRGGGGGGGSITIGIGNGLTLQGSVLSLGLADVFENGALSSDDWLTFNSKQAPLIGDGLVKSTGGTISYITDNTSNWNTAYNDKINSIAVTGTTTKTLTLTQQDGGTLTTSWTDDGSSITLTTLGTSGAATLVNNVLNIPQYSGGVTSFNTRTGAVTLSSGDVTTALGYTPYNNTNPNGYITASSESVLTNKTGNISQWTNNSGYLTGITSLQVTTALGFTPYNATNPNGYITGITSGMVTTALGFTPYNSTNPSGYMTASSANTLTNKSGNISQWTNNSGYLTSITSGQVTGALGYTPYNSTNPNGYISGITSGNVTTALGYTPYNSSNPSGYISGINSSMVTSALGYTPYNSTNPASYATTTQLNNGLALYLPLTGGYVSGNITSAGGFFNSDIRLKDIISRDGDVVVFKWKDGRDDKTHIGYIAQEVQEIFPDAINEGEDGMLSVNYTEVLVAKIAELEKRIKQLEK